MSFAKKVKKNIGKIYIKRMFGIMQLYNILVHPLYNLSERLREEGKLTLKEDDIADEFLYLLHAYDISTTTKVVNLVYDNLMFPIEINTQEELIDFYIDFLTDYINNLSFVLTGEYPDEGDMEIDEEYEEDYY